MSTQPMFPLQSALLPGETLPLRVFEPRYSRLVEDCLASPSGPTFGVVLIRRGSEVGGGDIRHDVGTLARITDYAVLGEGRYELRAAVGQRIRVSQWLPEDPYPRAVVEEWPDEPGVPVGPEQLGPLVDGILALYRRIATARGESVPEDVVAMGVPAAEDPARYLWGLASWVPMGPADRYAVLAAPTLSERVAVLVDAVENVTAIVEFQLSQE